MHLSCNILIMDLNNFTNKSQEIISNAQYLTTENGHQAIENAHILSALIKIDKNVFPFITKKIGANTTIIDKANKSILQNYPKVNGSSVYLSKNSQTTINESIKISKKMNDDFISIEHLILGMLKSNDPTSQLLKK
jgi:ATP-dependent Clp protease ATP-binding subunit ClpB